MLHCWQSHIAQQNKREITVSFPWQHFQYSYFVCCRSYLSKLARPICLLRRAKIQTCQVMLYTHNASFISVLLSIVTLLSKFKYGHQLHSRKGYKSACWWMIKITMGQTTFYPSFIIYHSKSKHYCTLYWSVKCTMYKQKNRIKTTSSVTNMKTYDNSNINHQQRIPSTVFFKHFWLSKPFSDWNISQNSIPVFEWAKWESF